MKRYIYQISLKKHTFFYDPILNTLFFPETKRRMVIRKDKGNYFPDNKLLQSKLTEKNFKPNILTIFQGTYCNLDCKYCYAEDKNHNGYINLDFVENIANKIGRNCKKYKQPFILGFRGSNEPLLKLDLIKSCLEICKAIANKYKLKFYTHTITNGVIPEETAVWAANNIDEILLSWDGPEHIQNENRVFPNGKGSFRHVENTAKILLKSKTKLQVRATITKSSENKLIEIARFFMGFGIKDIDFNPLYQNEDISVDKSYFPEKSLFVKNYLLVKKWAGANNINIEFAGSRINSLHDKQCSLFQKNIVVTPDNYLTACFQATHNHENKNDKYMFGNQSEDKNGMQINWQKLNNLYNDLSLTYPQCSNCFNILHCNKSCPNICPLRDNYSNFDCTIEKWIGLSEILLQAGYKFTNEDLENCSNFFSNIRIKQLTI